MKRTELETLIHAAVFSPNEGGKWGIPVILWSAPGFGKSSILAQWARKSGLKSFPVILSQLDQSDMKMDLPVEDEAYMRTVINGDMQAVMNEPNSIILFDEYSEADDRMQSLSMRLLLERELGSTKLPSTAVPICLANPVGRGCAASQTSEPAANRMTHVSMEKWFPAADSAHAWCEWADGTVTKEASMMEAFLTGKITALDEYTDDVETLDPDAERRRVAAAWPDAFKKAMAVVTAFIRSTPDSLQPEGKGSFRPKGLDDLAFPTKRSVAKVGRVLAAAEVHDLSDRMKRCLLEGTTGTAWTSAFLIHARNFESLPNVEAVLDGYETYKHNKSKPDILRTVLTSAMSITSNTKEDAALKESRIAAMWKLMGDVYTEDAMAIDQLKPFSDEMSDRDWVSAKHMGVAGPLLKKLLYVFKG